jgi:hypothetical protein
MTIAMPRGAAASQVDQIAQLADPAELLFVGHDDEVPWLEIPRTSGPLRDLQNLLDDVFGNFLVCVLTDLPDGPHALDHFEKRS